MKALVTGGGGFLGLYVVEQLVKRGDLVRSLCRGHYPQLDALGVESLHTDLRDREGVMAACRDVDIVFHVGGVAGIAGLWKRYYQTNTLGTQHLIDGCRKHGVGRLVYTSSPSVTFSGQHQIAVDETIPYPKRWLCHYARSKALAEQAVLAANGTEGLLTCALRPHLIWGPRDPHLIPRLLADARCGRLCRVGDGTNLVDTVYVENAAVAHVLAADALRPGSPVAGQAYFISQGEPVNCWAWINRILATAGLPPVQKATSLRTAWALGALYEAVYGLFRWTDAPPMSRFLAMQLAVSHYFDIRRARTDFGYDPKISMDEGLQRLAAELSANGHGTKPRAIVDPAE